MTQWQLEGFRRSLEELLRRALARGDHLMRTFGRTTVHFCADDNDRGTLEAERNLLLVQAEREHSLSKEIRSALHRVAQGQYGICDECGEPIALRRLEVQPMTRFCRQCQEDMENRGNVLREGAFPPGLV